MVLKGFMHTLKISPKLVIFESLRRMFGKTYIYDGFRVTTLEEFKALRRALQLGYKLTREGSDYVLDVGWGKFYVSDLGGLAGLLWEDFSSMYDVDVDGRDVLDIGAFIGDTPVWFYKRGARRVTAYEPAYYDVCRRNMQVNEVRGECIGKGVWGRRGRLNIALAGAGSGQEPGSFLIEVEDLSEVLGHGYDVAKLDCEGCEWWLLTLPCDVLRNVDTYVIELHGPVLPLLDKMRSCGYELRSEKGLKDYITVLAFDRM